MSLIRVGLLEKIKDQISRNLTLISNFSYLTILHFFNLILQLISYPYLIRILEPSVYGKVAFAQGVILYFSIIITFGFHISATEEISKNRSNVERLNEIISSVYLLKGFLWILSLTALILLISYIPFFSANSILFLASFGLTFNEFLFPTWFFQGVEKMRYITILNVLSKTIFTSLVFIFVNSKSDYLFVPVFNSLGAFISSIIGLFVLFRTYKVHFVLPSFKTLKFYFFESLPLFISSASVQVYVNANRVLVGAFLGMKEVAYYDFGEKILRLLKIPVSMLGQAAFPAMAREKNIFKINVLMLIGIIIALVPMVIIFLFSDYVVNIIGGEEMLPAISVMKILSVAALMSALAQFLGINRLIVFGLKKQFTLIITSSGIVFCMSAALLYAFNSIGVISLAWLAVAIEMWGLVLMLIVNFRKNLLWPNMTI